MLTLKQNVNKKNRAIKGKPALISMIYTIQASEKNSITCL